MWTFHIRHVLRKFPVSVAKIQWRSDSGVRRQAYVRKIGFQGSQACNMTALHHLVNPEVGVGNA